MSFLRMAQSSLGMLVACLVVAFAVVFRGGSMCLSGVLVMFCCFVVCVFCNCVLLIFLLRIVSVSSQLHTMRRINIRTDVAGACAVMWHCGTKKKNVQRRH
jgi:hypothetical protein